MHPHLHRAEVDGVVPLWARVLVEGFEHVVDGKLVGGREVLVSFATKSQGKGREAISEECPFKNFKNFKKLPRIHE